MRHKLIAPAALVGVLLAASYCWAPPPRPRPRPSTPSPTPSFPSRAPSLPSRPPIGSAKPAFGASFESARARSAAEAAEVLRKQGAFLARTQRAAMLTLVVHQALRQPHPASLAELRQLRADCGGIGPGAGIDPIVLMELEAAESAGERALLAEILQLIADGRYLEAADKIDKLESPRHLPAAVVQARPGLRDELKRTAPLVRMRDALNEANATFSGVWAAVADGPPKQLPPAVTRAAGAWNALGVAERLFAESRSLEDIDRALRAVSDAAGAGVARKLRAELAARLLLSERPKEATQLLDGEVDPAHAAAVLADLRAAALGRGALAVPQIGELARAAGDKRPAVADTLLPPDQLTKWNPPLRKPGETTVGVAIADAKSKLKVAVGAEAEAGIAKVNAAADLVRAALAAEAAPLKPFVEKVEAMRGKPFATPVERQLAVVTAARGFTVAEAVGVLAADADRPASAARLLATAPAFTNPAVFATAVEVSGRAPAAFAPHPDAGFKLAAPPNRARTRDAVSATVGSHAQKVANGQNPEPPGRTELEAAVANRLGAAPGAVQPAEMVQALLDVCRDGADDYARLADAARTLDGAVAEIEDARRDDDNQELRDEFTIAKGRRIAVQYDRKRAEAAVTAGCNLLGAYGPEARPALPWLRSQDEWKPWRAAAIAAGARITEGK